MFGPLFWFEFELRMGRLDLFRRCYAAFLCLQVWFWCLFYTSESANEGFDGAVLGWYIEIGLIWFSGQQAILLLLTIPTLVAGSLTDEKSQGTLEVLLTSNVTPSEVIVGRTMSRLLQVTWVTLPGWPIMVLFAGLHGVPWWAIVGLGVWVIGPLFALASASMLAAVWSRQTRDALLRLVTTVTIGIAALWCYERWAPSPAGGPALFHVADFCVRCLDPAFVVAPVEGEESGQFLRRAAVSLAWWCGLGIVGIAVACWRLRPAFLRQLAPPRAEINRPTLEVDENAPIIWKERAIERLAPLAGTPLMPAWAMPAVIATITSAYFALMPTPGLPRRAPALVALALSSLYVVARTSATITRERERHTWSLLLLTPLSNRELLQHRLYGTLRSVYPGLLAYAVPAFGFSFYLGQAHLAWTAAMLILTVSVLYFLGAIGICRSLRATSTWRSLLVTLIMGYAYGFLIFLITAALMGGGMVLMVGLDDALAATVFLIASAIIGAIFWQVGRKEMLKSLAWMREREGMANTEERREYLKRFPMEAAESMLGAAATTPKGNSQESGTGAISTSPPGLT